MALSWLKEGEKIVLAPGIIDVCWKGDDPVFQRDPVDLFHLQEQGLDESYGKKDKKTGIQSYFKCLLCECDMMSIKTLRYHSTGNQHVLNACEIENKYKREQRNKKDQEFNMKPDPDDNNTEYDLFSVLSKQKKSIVGLRYITEFVHEDRKPLYHCRLLQCNDTQGDAGRMSQHIFTVKHRASWIREDKDVNHLVTTEAVCNYADEHKEDLKKHYSEVHQINDLGKYKDVMHEKFRGKSGLPPLKKKSNFPDGADVKRFRASPDPDISVPEALASADVPKTEQKPQIRQQGLLNEDVFKRFKRDVAEVVKTCLNHYYEFSPDYVPGNRKMTKEEYVEEAKFLTKQLKKQLMAGYHSTNSTYLGIKMTPDFELNIKTQCQTHLEQKFPQNQN